MKRSAPHLADEHMNLYEWSGGVAPFGATAETRRPRRSIAAHGTLAALVSLLLLTGCASLSPMDKPDPPAGNPGGSASPPAPTP